MLLGFIIIVICLILAGVLAFYFLQQSKKILISAEIPPEILSSYNFLSEQVESLNASCLALDHLVNEYFITLTQGGYSELNSLRTNLNQIIETAKKLLSEGDADELSLVIDYALLNSDQQQIPSSLENKFDSKEPIKNWNERSQQLLQKIETALSEVSTKYKKAGRSQKRERLATDSVLGEVRKAMLKVAKQTPAK